MSMQRRWRIVGGGRLLAVLLLAAARGGGGRPRAAAGGGRRRQAQHQQQQRRWRRASKQHAGRGGAAPARAAPAAGAALARSRAAAAAGSSPGLCTRLFFNRVGWLVALSDHWLVGGRWLGGWRALVGLVSEWWLARWVAVVGYNKLVVPKTAARPNPRAGRLSLASPRSVVVLGTRRSTERAVGEASFARKKTRPKNRSVNKWQHSTPKVPAGGHGRAPRQGNTYSWLVAWWLVVGVAELPPPTR